MLNPNAEKWVAALESGEYKQTTGRLRSNNPHNSKNEFSFCCLGVACDLYQKETGEGAWEDTGTYFYPEGRPEDYASIMPPKVAEWLGLTCIVTMTVGSHS